METEHDDAYDAPRAGGAAAAASTSGPAAAAQGGDAAGAGTTDSATLRSILEEAEAKAELGEDGMRCSFPVLSGCRALWR